MGRSREQVIWDFVHDRLGKDGSADLLSKVCGF
jgi:hypothetical protein